VSSSSTVSETPSVPATDRYARLLEGADRVALRAAVAVYEAKVVTTRVALDATSRLFEIQGARATTAAYGFDRHWRNVRTHTVHDPVAYKAREVGDWALNRHAPEFSLYR
jgi:alkylation response protein AidB-like acyl-CoA dehydrogenase